MIPLRTSEPATRFPTATLVGVFLWLFADVISRAEIFFRPHLRRTEFLQLFAFVPAELSPGATLSFLWFPNFFSLCVGLIFFWVFSPRVFERRGWLLALLMGLSGIAFSLLTFKGIHSDSTAPILCPEAFLGTFLGIFMRREIWGTISTLVIGPGWIRVLEVPAYVLLFFWLFYLLVSNFFLSEPFSDAPMLYWLPFSSFLWGFALESLVGVLFDGTKNSAAEQNS